MKKAGAPFEKGELKFSQSETAILEKKQKKKSLKEA